MAFLLVPIISIFKILSPTLDAVPLKATLLPVDEETTSALREAGWKKQGELTVEEKKELEESPVRKLFDGKVSPHLLILHPVCLRLILMCSVCP